MEHQTKKELFILIKILFIVIIIEAFIFSGCYNYLYFNNYDNEQKKIKFQDTNLVISNNDSNVKIEYGNLPNYLYEYVDCINNGLNSNNFSSLLNNKINDLNKYVNKFPLKIGFAYEDINSGFHLGYNENDSVFAASTTKGPVAMYIYKLADNNKVDLNKKYKYTSKYQASGTGILKNKPLNTSYSLKDLTKYSIIYSDNSAYLMLTNVVKKKDVSKYYSSIGTNHTFNSKNKKGLYPMFGEISAHDGNIYMIDLYKYSLNNTKNSNELIDYFKNAGLNNIKKATNKPVAHKYGWTDIYVNDMALVFDENPYVISITSKLGDSNWQKVFTNIGSKVQEIHRLYWTETKNYCKNNIK